MVLFSTLEQWKMCYEKATDKMTKAVLHSFYFVGTNIYPQKDNNKRGADYNSRSLNVCLRFCHQRLFNPQCEKVSFSGQIATNMILKYLFCNKSHRSSFFKPSLCPAGVLLGYWKFHIMWKLLDHAFLFSMTFSQSRRIYKNNCIWKCNHCSLAIYI